MGNKPTYVIVLKYTTRQSASAMAAGCEYALRLLLWSCCRREKIPVFARLFVLIKSLSKNLPCEYYVLDISNFVLHTVYSCARWCYCRAEQERRLRNGQFCKVRQLVVIALVFIASQLMPVSHARAVDSVLVNCVETPGINDTKDNHRPDVFNLSNNLARRVGSADVARGKVIYLVGRVTDAHCTPLTNVNVFIWQADSRVFMLVREATIRSFLGLVKLPQITWAILALLL
ncbi:dioxygenase family protein [Anaplasma phagocytophilum str. ApNP]|uniref:Dioxygenase family protein n=1 Tax=Anaplasma phagocytophilum str. ApNP TaxID=1359153 RepID=A0A0F3NHW2_ANAPH|nr:dioxygenase family protein [Anaplasma phagocytophilum str. ApNP]